MTLPAVRHDLTSLPARDRGQQDDSHNDWTYETGSAQRDAPTRARPFFSLPGGPKGMECGAARGLWRTFGDPLAGAKPVEPVGELLHSARWPGGQRRFPRRSGRGEPFAHADDTGELRREVHVDLRRWTRDFRTCKAYGLK
ncbi:hypothetical protein GCM10023068_42560 [Leifsonia shinshuensis]